MEGVEDFDVLMESSTRRFEEMMQTFRERCDHFQMRLDPEGALAAKAAGPADGPAHADGPEVDGHGAAGLDDAPVPPWRRLTSGPLAAPP